MVVFCRSQTVGAATFIPYSCAPGAHHQQVGNPPYNAASTRLGVNGNCRMRTPAASKNAQIHRAPHPFTACGKWGEPARAKPEPDHKRKSGTQCCEVQLGKTTFD
jgi:hypothetical protein